MKYKNYLDKIKGFSPKTIEIYSKYAKELDKYNLDYFKLLENTSNYSTNTMRLIISAIISYYKFLKDERWEELSLPKKEFSFKEYISFKDYKTILEGINFKTKMGYQMRVIVRLLFETGIRSQELLDIKKIDIKNNQIKINGKGKRQRVVKVSDWLLDELNFYLKKTNDMLFNFGYKNLHKRISNLSKNKKITPHMFRRGYAKYCHEKGVSIYDISLSMGHSNLETTASYIKRDSEDVEIYKIF